MARRTPQDCLADLAAESAEEALARAWLDATTVAVVVFGPAGDVVARNERSTELLDADDERLALGTPGSVAGWRDDEHRPIAADEHPAVLARTASGPVTRELCIARPGHERRWVLASARVVVDAAGAGAIVLTLSDITELRAARLELARCHEELHRVATVAAHDLGIPLAVLRQGLAAIEPDDLRDAVAEGLRAARAAADVMQEVIGAVLSYAHMDGEVIGEETVDLAATAGEVLMLLRGHLRETGASVSVGDLPVSGEARCCFASCCRTSSSTRSPTTRGRPRTSRSGPRSVTATVVIVEDDGDGVPAGERESVFGLFARGGSPTAGYGIGLSAAKRIVERHGGRIWIEDAAPHGARFCIAL